MEAQGQNEWRQAQPRKPGGAGAIAIKKFEIQESESQDLPAKLFKVAYEVGY